METILQVEDRAATTEPEFYPQHLWGLDFHFNTFNKFYISDILRMEPYPAYPGAFAYGNHPVYKVDVVGVVVRKDDMRKLFLYSVDDGTGVINCCCWKRHIVNDGDGAAELPDASLLSQPLQSELLALQEARQQDITAYELGDLVHVRGKLKMFRDMMEVVAYYHCKLNDPNRQTKRMQELCHLYQHCYDKPFEPPHNIQEELLGLKAGKGLSTQKVQSLMEQLMRKIEEVLHRQKLEEFSPQDLLQDTDVSHLAKQDPNNSSTALLTNALKQLEEAEGSVCQRCRTSPPFETDTCTRSTSILLHEYRDRNQSSDADKGCHYLHVLDEVRRTVQYSALHRSALLHLLRRLETDSDVIQVTDRCYMPM